VIETLPALVRGYSTTLRASRGAPKHRSDVEGHHVVDRDGSNDLLARRLTEIERERLQGFPDDYTKCGVGERGERIDLSETPA